MSPKADIQFVSEQVRFVPKADNWPMDGLQAALIIWSIVSITNWILSACSVWFTWINRWRGLPA